MQLKDRTKSFVFDDWKELAETDPQAFEQKRQNYIDSFISTAPSQHQGRLEGLQWRIDMERQRSSSPMSACVRISSMMLDSVYGEAGLVSALTGDLLRQRNKVCSARVVKIADIKRARSGA